MSTRNEQSVARTRDADSRFPGGPSSQQIQVLGVQLADDVAKQDSPAGLAGAVSRAFRDLTHRISVALEKISGKVGPLEEGVGNSVAGPPSGVSDNAIARWDGTPGRKLQNSGWYVLDAISGNFPLTNLSTYSGQDSLHVEEDAPSVEIKGTTGDATLKIHSAGTNRDELLEFIHSSSIKAKIYYDSSANEFIIESGTGVIFSDSGVARAKIDTSGYFSGTVNVYSATIASGDIALPSHTLPGVWVVIADTESAAATDDLDHITGGVEGDILYVRQANSARDITIKHAVDANPGRFVNQASGSADIVFVDTTSVAHYINRSAAVWDEVASQV